jgi:hypothetical protein
MIKVRTMVSDELLDLGAKLVVLLQMCMCSLTACILKNQTQRQLEK